MAGPTETGNEIEIIVNGTPRRLPSGLSVEGLLAALSVEPSRVAVERNRLIVKRAQWSMTRIEPGDQLEVVQFVGGG